MTTILVCRRERLMVTDSKCTNGQLSFRTPKTKVVRGHVIGAAGDCLATDVFMRKYPRLEIKVKDPVDFEGVALTPEGIVTYDRLMNPMVVDEDYYATGGGAVAALAVIEYQRAAGLPIDPVAAVEAVCVVDEGSGGPVIVTRLPAPGKKKKKKEAA